MLCEKISPPISNKPFVTLDWACPPKRYRLHAVNIWASLDPIYSHPEGPTLPLFKAVLQLLSFQIPVLSSYRAAVTSAQSTQRQLHTERY